MQVIKAKSKSQLAVILGVHLNTMMRWIIKDKKLLKALKMQGYEKSRKVLDPTMCTLILQRFAKTKGISIEDIINKA